MAKANKQPVYGPDNPHPLSTLKTELVWEGKYDEFGNRREVDIAGCAMPMQRIETIDQPRSEAAATGQLCVVSVASRKSSTPPCQIRPLHQSTVCESPGSKFQPKSYRWSFLAGTASRAGCLSLSWPAKVLEAERERQGGHF